MMTKVKKRRRKVLKKRPISADIPYKHLISDTPQHEESSRGVAVQTPFDRESRCKKYAFKVLSTGAFIYFIFSL
jgi:hypothetical protein